MNLAMGVLSMSCSAIAVCSSIVKKIQVVQWIRIMIQVKCNLLSFCGIATQNIIDFKNLKIVMIGAKGNNEYN